FLFAQFCHHYSFGYNHPDRVPDPLACNVRGRPVHWLEEASLRLGIDASRGRDAHAPDQLGGEVGEDVAEEVARDDDLELRGVAHQLHGGGVDIEMTRLDVRVLL